MKHRYLVRMPIVAALVTILVCFAFLGSWQGALNIIFSIPTSIVGTFLIIYFAGFTLNLFTLLALTPADDASSRCEIRSMPRAAAI